eukprot:TRINITY_DN72373_c0_g1_i1.p1 TRINITY_DN72373_c0_g1~~TRINITY_DN72373_c0_g1_i1.p1  ORF type:complete len:250 (-),score=7.21 TRINITY_DN72373_c0_g1_i1:213-962(-)
MRASPLHNQWRVSLSGADSHTTQQKATKLASPPRRVPAAAASFLTPTRQACDQATSSPSPKSPPDDQTESSGSSCEEVLPAPVTPVVGIRQLRRGREAGDLAGFGDGTKTQKVVRHRKKKLREKSPLTEQEKVEEERRRQEQWFQLKYVLKLQRAFRIRLSKKLTRARCEARKKAFQEEYENSNASIIQRAWRMYAARKRLQAVQTELESNAPGIANEVQLHISKALLSMMNNVITRNQEQQMLFAEEA